MTRNILVGNPVHDVFFCYQCYQDGHYTPDCTFKFREYPTIGLNYEKLNVYDKARVPFSSYNEEQQIFEADNE